ERQHRDRRDPGGDWSSRQARLAPLQLLAETSPLVSHAQRRLEPLARLLLEAATHDSIEIGRQVRPYARKWPGLLPQDGVADVHVRLARERPLSGSELVEHDAEREQVGARIHGLAADLLRRHVRY